MHACIVSAAKPVYWCGQKNINQCQVLQIQVKLSEIRQSRSLTNNLKSQTQPTSSIQMCFN